MAITIDSMDHSPHYNWSKTRAICKPARFVGSDANGTAAAGRGELLGRDLRLCTGQSVATRAASLQRDVDHASAQAHLGQWRYLWYE